MKIRDVLPFCTAIQSVCLFFGLLSIRTSAHEVWIEDTPEGKLVVRFAEYGDDFEKSPGALDAMHLRSAWSERNDSNAPAAGGATPSREEREKQVLRQDKAQTFEITKGSDHFLLNGASANKQAEAEADFAVMGVPGTAEKPARKPFFYARWQPEGGGAVQPSLDFDLVPTGNAGEACVYFRGKPVPGAKVTFYPPSAAEQELTSDDAGKVHFDDSKPGFYLLAASHHREAITGFSRGIAYGALSHNCSLTWRKK